MAEPVTPEDQQAVARVPEDLFLVRPRVASQHLSQDFFTLQYNSILFVAECVEQQACRGRDDLDSEPGGRREVRGAANAQRAGNQDPAEPS